MTPDATALEYDTSTAESPFLSDSTVAPGAATTATTSAARVFGQARQFESPFVREYAGEGPASPEAELFASVMNELHDPEFGEALEDLVNDAAAVAEQVPAYESEDSTRERRDAERAVREYLQPLQRASDAMFERLEAGLRDKDVAALSESEVESLFEQLAPPESDVPPVFEHFLGGLLKKAKAAVSKVGSLLPHNLILNKLKALVRPLLERVLKFALDKLPVAVRPIAQQLAKRFLNIGEAPTQEEPGVAHEAAAADPAQLQEEFDTQAAASLVASEALESEAGLQEAFGRDAEAGDALRELEQCRRMFAQRVTKLQSDEQLAPEVERFVPAILGALRLGIKIVGRPRVVNFLAGLVAKLIARYVGPEQAATLSRALVDAGLGLVSLEAADGRGPSVSGYALASTVEDTVNRLVETAPEAAWENEDLLEAYTLECFQKAASAHFPDPLIRSELHEASQASGAWVALPHRTSRKRYKKYTRIIDVTITPQIAATVRTFRGIPLADFLRDRLGITVDRPVRARVHLYEAIPGTTLSLIALHDKAVPGLGSPRRGAYSLFHPLTPEVAGALLGEPGLGRRASRRFLARRRHIAVGQRVYFLEIHGARVRYGRRGRRTLTRPARSTETRVVIDFPKREIRALLFYSEADAQELAKTLRKGLAPAAILSALKAKHDTGLAQLFQGQPPGNLRIVTETAPASEATPSPAVTALAAVAAPLSEVVLRGVLGGLTKELKERLDRFIGQFETAARTEVDGVTIVVVFAAPPLLAQLRPLMQPGGGAATAASTIAGQTLADARIEIRPGFASA